MPANTQKFSQLVLDWYQQHGRKDLPWQQNPTPYRVWVSEIMLQQTQVATVIPYYQRFMQRFPELSMLAKADTDEVLHYWSGLGYYARCRNLQQAARTVMQQHHGVVPDTLETLVALPGIGRSTAAAILSLALGQSHPILDGNVKRVLARCFAVAGWPGESRVQKTLWQYSEELTPCQRTGNYNQAMMDLGATVCRRTRPDCDACPLSGLCRAREQGDPTAYPMPKPSKRRPLRSVVMLLIHDEAGQVLMKQRPEQGVWGGLWGLPEFENQAQAEKQVAIWFGTADRQILELPERRHVFTHFQLQIKPLLVQVPVLGRSVMDGDQRVWYNTRQPDRRGLAAPVSRLLKELSQITRGED